MNERSTVYYTLYTVHRLSLVSDTIEFMLFILFKLNFTTQEIASFFIIR